MSLELMIAHGNYEDNWEPGYYNYGRLVMHDQDDYYHVPFHFNIRKHRSIDKKYIAMAYIRYRSVASEVTY